MKKKDQYLDLVGFDTPEQAYKKIKEWTSNLTDDDHLVRSVIFDIHAGIETLFRQIFYHYFKPIIFKTGKEAEDKKVFSDLEKMVDDLSFGQMYKILWPILKNWPYDFNHCALQRTVVENPAPTFCRTKKIVARLDSLSQKIKTVKELQNTTAADFSALRQSILAKSFQYS